MVRRYDRVSLALGIVAVACVLVAVLLRPQPIPPGSAHYRTVDANSSAPSDVPAEPGRTYAYDIVATGGASRPAGSPMPIISAGAISIQGWAIDPRTRAPGRRLLVSIDGSPAAAVTTYGLARPDVASAIAPSAANSGFIDDIPAHRLRPGKHTLHFTLIADDGRQTVFPTTVDLTLLAGE